MIFASELDKSFGETQAVSGLELQVQAGEIYGLVGPDGAGKTTTMRLLCAALLPDHGQIKIGEIDMLRQPEQGRELIGYLPQRFSMYEELTVRENLRFFAEVRGIRREAWQQRSREILEFVGLYDFIDRQAGKLSGGMKQKLGLAVALVHEPRVLLLDEPTTGVDPVTRQDFWQLIIRLAQDNQIAVLVSTPYMDEAARCHRLGFLRQGRLQLEGTPQDLRDHLAGQVLELQGSPLPQIRSIAAADPDVIDAQMFGDRLHLHIQAGTAEAVQQRLQQAVPAAGAQLTHLQLIPAQLEDVFIVLVANDHG